MSLRNIIQSWFDTGGIGVKLDLPQAFRWADGSIPATVTLKGHKSEPRLVHELTFTVRDDEKNDDGSPTQIEVVWTHEEPIELQPGETQTVHTSITLPKLETREEREQKAFGRKASGLVEKAFVSLAGGPSPDSIHRYLVTVEADVDGAARPKKASKHIRQGRGVTITAGGTSVKF